MEPVKAVYVRQGEDGIVLAGDFAEAIGDAHAGSEWEVTLEPIEHPDVAAEANGTAEPAEGTETPATETPAT